MSAAFAAVMFFTFMYVGLCITYLFDFFVRIVTNNRYGLITKLEK